MVSLSVISAVHRLLRRTRRRLLLITWCFAALLSRASDGRIATLWPKSVLQWASNNHITTTIGLQTPVQQRQLLLNDAANRLDLFEAWHCAEPYRSSRASRLNPSLAVDRHADVTDHARGC